MLGSVEEVEGVEGDTTGVGQDVGNGRPGVRLDLVERNRSLFMGHEERHGRDKLCDRGKLEHALDVSTLDHRAIGPHCRSGRCPRPIVDLAKSAGACVGHGINAR